MTRTLFCTTTRELCEHLQMSDRLIRSLRRQGVFVVGKHFRHIGTGTVRPRIRWNLPAVEEAITYRSKRLKVGA